MIEPCASLYHRHRFLAEIIAEAVWLYYRFPLNFRMVEDMLAYGGIIVTHKTVHECAEKFGREYANIIRRRTARLGEKWHLDEVVITIKDEKHFCGARLIRRWLCTRCSSAEAPQYQGCETFHA